MASGIVALKDGGEGPAVVRNGRNWSANFVAITAAVMASRSRGCPGRRGGRALPKGPGCCATAWAGSPKPACATQLLIRSLRRQGQGPVVRS